MIKRQKVELNAQTIYLGPNAGLNPLATSMQFLKYCGIRLPYQFCNLCDDTEALQKASMSLVSFLLADHAVNQTHDLAHAFEELKKSHMYNLVELLKSEAGLRDKWASPLSELDQQSVSLAKLCQALLKNEKQFLVTELSDQTIGNQLAPLVLSALAEHTELTASTIFLMTDDLETWGGTINYQLARNERSEFALEAYLHHDAHILTFAPKAEASDISSIATSEKNQAQSLKKIG